MGPETPKATYTLAEAAELLHCHKTTLRKAIFEGSLQAARLGRDYRISRLDLQRFWVKKGGGALFEGVPETIPPPSEEKERQIKKSQKQEPQQLSLFDSK